MTSSILLLVITSAALLPLASGHGFLSTPRSRNLVAFEDRVYHGESETDPFPEDCPTCINRGGTLARCGILRPGSVDERNYDFPKNALGDAMPANPQNVYEENSIIDVEVVLSAHHKGHFTFKACPIPFTTISPTQDCFDKHPLIFVSDELYGATPDVNHPERAYVAPDHHPNKVTSTKPGFDRAMVFRYKMKLPPGITGDLVLIQWYYIASNSGCVHAGYAEYPWPDDWIWDMNEDEGVSDWESKVSVGTGLKGCEEKGLIPPDGEGVPEQFWNCAEVSIVPEGTLAAKSSDGNTQLQSEKTIIGYWASWQWYDRQKFAEPWAFDYRKYTRVNFAFFQVNEDGDMWGTDSWADPNTLFGPYNWNGVEGVDTKYCSWDYPEKKVCNFHHYEKGLLYLVKAAGAEIWPSIGGWSLSDPFPVMAKNEASRTRFVNKCVELIEEYGFDGIDIDWEYPGYEDHSGTPDDTESYNLLLRDIRGKLDELGEKNCKFYGLTAALPCGTSHINNIDIPTAAKYLTELNLMTYDFFGAWSPTTGVNAPLYDQDWGGPDVARYSIDGCVKNWIEGGGSPDQINIGLPFYGRGYLKATGLNQTHPGKPDENIWWQDEGSPQYFNIVNKLKDLVSVRHELTATQYAYNPEVVNGIEVGGVVSYDDEEAICDKTHYCLEHKLNGFIIWEMSGDLMDDYSTPLIDAVHAKLRDLDLDCKKFAYDPDTFSGYATPLGNEVSASFARVESGADGPTMAPAKEMSCPTQWFWGVLQWNECQSYYRCANGNPDMSTLTHCPEGELFDETSQGCKAASQVTCSEVASPTASPVKAGMAMLADQSDTSGFQYEPECPIDLSNFKAGPGCTSYFRCNAGEVVSPIIACQPGTLFDESLSICNFEDNVECTTTDAPMSVSTPQATQQPITREPSQQLIASKPTESFVHEVQNKPLIIPQTPNPSRHPTPYPSEQPANGEPSHRPTATELVVNLPPAPPYDIIQTESNTLMLVQRPNPTREPTRRPIQTSRPTKRRNPITGDNTMASSFINMPTHEYTMETSGSTMTIVAEYTNKGQESSSIGDAIKNQIQQQQQQKRQKKMGVKKAKLGGKRGKRGYGKGSGRRPGKRLKQLERLQKIQARLQKRQQKP